MYCLQGIYCKFVNELYGGIYEKNFIQAFVLAFGGNNVNVGFGGVLC